jgi:hypothetical protein
MVDEA